MRTTRCAVWVLLVCLNVVCVKMASSQSDAIRPPNYPVKPIRIMTSEPGGGNDLASRFIAQELTVSLGQQIIIDNRPGPVAAIEGVAKAAPDGYTLLVTGTPLWLLQFLRDNITIDPLRDFSPINLAVTSPNILVVHPSLPVRSVRDLIALAKAKPGQLNYGSSGAGASNHLGAELFKAMASIDIMRVTYKGTGLMTNALLGGEVQLIFSTSGSVVPHVKSGKLRALGVTSAQPSALLPELPTVAASLPGFVSGGIVGFFAPAKTPPVIVNTLHQEIVRALGMPKVKERFFASGSEVVGGPPEELTATIKSEISRMGKVIRDAGIRAE